MKGNRNKSIEYELYVVISSPLKDLYEIMIVIESKGRFLNPQVFLRSEAAAGDEQLYDMLSEIQYKGVEEYIMSFIEEKLAKNKEVNRVGRDIDTLIKDISKKRLTLDLSKEDIDILKRG